MSELPWIRREQQVQLDQGLHMTPLSQINRLAAGFSGDLRITNGHYSANAKSMLELLQLNAPHGTILLIEACGPEAAAIVEGVSRLIANGPSAS